RIGLRRIDRELDDLEATLTNILTDELGEMSDPVAAAAEAHRTMAVPNRAIASFDGAGHLLAASWKGLTLDRGLPGLGPQTQTLDSRGNPWRVHTRPESIGGRTFILLVAAPMTDVYRERHETREAMFVGIPLALLVAAAGGLWLAMVGLRPITVMANRASALAPSSVEDLGESDREDELGQLARAFNGLVARLR